MSFIPKVNVGVFSKRYKHNMDCSTNTTTDFAFCQPYHCWFVPSKTHVNLQTGCSVRLAPMPAPTFGQVDMKLFTNFVKMSEIYPPFEHLMKGDTYPSVISPYVPVETPSISLHYLVQFLMCYSRVSIWRVTNSGPDTSTVFEGSAQLETVSQTLASVRSHFVNNVIDGNLRVGLGQVDVNFEPCRLSSDTISLDRADFVYRFVDTAFSPSVTWILCFNFSQTAKHVAYVLQGLGYKLSYVEEYVDVLRILAYYKSYFDCLFPKRNINWKSTNAYEFINYQANYDSAVEDYPLELFAKVLYDISLCYYTDNQNFVSVHIPNTAVSNTDSSVPVVTANGTETVVFANESSLPSISSTSSVQAHFDVLRRLTELVNKNTVFGGKLVDFIKARFGYTPEDFDSKLVGVDTIECPISDVFSTNASSTVKLAEYAGKGQGHGAGEMYNFDPDGFGYLIVFGAVVPVGSDYVQGLDPTLFAFGKEDFPQAEYDALGFEITRKCSVLGDINVAGDSWSTNLQKYTYGFGFVPRYTAFKYAHNIVNGDQSRVSTRDSYSPYNLQKLISSVQMDITPGSDDTVEFTIREMNYDDITASVMWRFVNRYKFIGNLDKIFYNQPVTDFFKNSVVNPSLNIDSVLFDFDDNFIVDVVFDCTFTNTMKSLSDSFDTGDSDDYKVEHS